MLEGLRILVVEDVLDDRVLLTILLEQQGAEVLAESCARDGLATLEREDLDALLSDIAMPGEDGYAFIRQVRRLSPAHGGLIPAAAVTAFATAEEGRRVRAAGFDVHFPKPVDARALARMIAGLTGRLSAPSAPIPGR